jgi:hypothetical protein
MIALAGRIASYPDYNKLQGLNPDGSRNPDFPVWLDETNYIDYSLLRI